MRIITLLVFLGFQLALSAQGSSYIQVKSEEGVTVFLDGTFVGKTSAEFGGLIIDNVGAGSHTIKVVKKGFSSQEESISIKEGEVFVFQVKPFVPGILIEQSGNSGDQDIGLSVGNLKIQSIPVEISIRIPELDVTSSKNKDEWNAKDIPVGVYAAIFKWNGKVLMDEFEIREDKLTHLFVNMIEEEIENRGEGVAAVAVAAVATETLPDEEPPLDPDNSGYLVDLRDGKDYRWVQYGAQKWMVENLAFEPEEGSYCYDRKEANCEQYGRLYNWETAKNVCPEGWHLPHDYEWKILELHLGLNIHEADKFGDRGNIGGKLKEKGTVHWRSPNRWATNESGFSARGGGVRGSSGGFFEFKKLAFFWTATSNDAFNGKDTPSRQALGRVLIFDSRYVRRMRAKHVEGLSVRCVENPN